MIAYLIRHPAPMGAGGLCYGRTDLEVAPEEVARVAGLVRAQLEGGVDRWVSSPLTRCVALADALAPTFTIDDRLVELDFGAWEGRPWDDLDSGEIEAWSRDVVHRSPPGGETWEELRARASSFMADLGSEPGAVGIIAHAGVIRAIVAQVLGGPLVGTWHLRIPFGHVLALDLPGDPDV